MNISHNAPPLIIPLGFCHYTLLFEYVVSHDDNNGTRNNIHESIIANILLLNNFLFINNLLYFFKFKSFCGGSGGVDSDVGGDGSGLFPLVLL